MLRGICRYCYGASIFFIFLFGVIWYNNTYNQHLHILSNGSIVVHSHPYTNTDGENSPFQSHHHTIFDVFSLSNIELLFFVAALIYMLARLTRKVEYFNPTIPFFSYDGLASPRGRAPPRFF